jgi:mannose/fructose/N-acetylgalactosamine-specific phosphotransferase system component IIC
MTGLEALAVVTAGTFVGLDVASVPQAMFSRPLVAGLLGGAIVGAPLPGLAIGAVLELFALDLLPVGASRVPDWGPGSVAAGALAGARHDGFVAPGILGLVLVAVVSAWAGGWLSHRARRLNTDDVHAWSAAIESGDAATLRRMQWRGLVRDALRSFILSTLALGLGDLVSVLFARRWGGPAAVAQVALAATSVGVALHAGWRRAGRGPDLIWFVGGLGAGLGAVALWLR